ncbi:MAG: hypothetical protein J0L67_06260 [Cytophagales bacterium]|nr:hypothetical protein [Cytophagales bacterium]
MGVVNTGVVNVLLVWPAMAVPPVASVYHLYCPAAPPAAVSVTLAARHDSAPVVVGALGGILIVAVTVVRVPSQNPLLMAT